MPSLVKWLIVLVMCVAIVALFRMGATAPAGALSFILFLTALAERLLRIRYIHNMHQRMNAASGGNSTGRKGEMTEEEALEILGLKVNPTEKEIKDAYKKLMKSLHPDKGGSQYLASQINNAKDILLQKHHRKKS